MKGKVVFILYNTVFPYPYWAIDVTDLIPSELVEDTMTHKQGETVDEVGPGVNGRIEVWGLTGWYLSLLMKMMQIYQ